MERILSSYIKDTFFRNRKSLKFKSEENKTYINNTHFDNPISVYLVKRLIRKKKKTMSLMRIRKRRFAPGNA